MGRGQTSGGTGLRPTKSSHIHPLLEAPGLSHPTHNGKVMPHFMQIETLFVSTGKSGCQKSPREERDDGVDDMCPRFIFYHMLRICQPARFPDLRRSAKLSADAKGQKCGFASHKL